MIHHLLFIFRVIDLQQELDDYTENSAQLEKELEASLVQVEKQNRDLEHQNQRLKNEIEMLRVSIFLLGFNMCKRQSVLIMLIIF